MSGGVCDPSRMAAVRKPRLKARVIREGLRTYLADNTQAWEMDGDGRYGRRRRAGTPRTFGTFSFRTRLPIFPAWPGAGRFHWS